MDMKAFQNPSPLYRNGPFWSWNDKLDADELRRQIDEMAEKGWGSYFMHSRVGLVTGYLTDRWFEMIKACAEQARATNTYAWLYDEDKWPSGFAGGEVSKEERYRSRALVLLQDDELTQDDTILLDMEYDNKKYHICRRVSPLGSAWFNGACYVDLMNPEAVEAFINATHERYKENCGEYFGKEIPGIFTDEPCYLMANHYKVPVLPWSDFLPDYFFKLKNYSILDHLDELFLDIKDYRKTRFDFYDAATRLFLESFTQPYYKWCEENKLIMTGHFMAEDTMISQIQWIGAAMPHYEFMHWPGIDKLGRHLEQLVTVKQVSSAVDQLEKERAFCEVFGCMGQNASFFHRKWISDWQAALGISFVNSHLSLYSMRGERKRDYPSNLFYQQAWWEDERKYADYTARLCQAVTLGRREVDILVLHPIASVWSEYSPLHNGSSLQIEKQLYDEPFAALSKRLIAEKLDFHYGDEMIMENHSRVENGKLVIGRHAYSRILVPPACTLRSNTLRLLQEFITATSPEHVIFMKPWPERIDGEKTSISWPAGISIAKSVEEAVSILDKAYSDRIKITDADTGMNAPKIICHERVCIVENPEQKQGEIQVDNFEERYIFLANNEEKKEVRTVISLPGEMNPFVLDLMSGEIYEIPARTSGGRTELTVTFYPAGSLLLYGPGRPVQAKPAPAFLDTGVSLKNVPAASRTILNWDVTLTERNVLPLQHVTLYLNDREAAKNEHVSKIWHNLFYNADEGTKFKAVYTFDVGQLPQGEIFAAVEAAENLDIITFNGTKVTPCKEKGEMGRLDHSKSWKDVSFTRVPLTGLLRSGENVLVLEGKKSNNITGPGCHVRVEDFENHFPTEVETVYIVGDFCVVDEDRINFSITSKPSVMPSAYNLTVSGYPFYPGKAEFRSAFCHGETGGRIYLRVNNVEAACAELYINGKYVDVKYWTPYLYDITDYVQDGENEIKVVTAATLFNTTGPGWISGIEDIPYVGPRTFVDFSKFTEKTQLIPFGIGSASLITL